MTSHVTSSVFCNLIDLTELKLGGRQLIWYSEVQM